MSDETLIDYQMRLYRNKDAYGLSNEEIGRILNEEGDICKDESAWRKYTYAFLDGYDYAVADSTDSNVALLELREAQDELYKERIRLQDVRREHRAELRLEARAEKLQEVVVESASIIANSKPLLEIETEVDFDGETTKVAVLQISDWHYGDFVDRFMNQFDKQEFYNRVSKLVHETAEIMKKEKFDKLIVINQGDLVSGSIHISTRVNEECDVISQTIEVAEVIAEMLNELSRYTNTVEYKGITDNHSRLTKNKMAHIERENFQSLIKWHLDTRFENHSKVKITNNVIDGFEEIEIGYIEIFDKVAFFTHGHHDRLNSIIPDLTLMLKEMPITVFTGHNHKNYEDEVHGIDLIMCPSLIGVSDYSMQVRLTSKPRQKLTVFENDGKETRRSHTYLIDVV